MNLSIFENKKITTLLKKNHVELLGVFGSSARGEERPDSDIDLLVRFSKRNGLLDHIRLERELGELLGKKVDLVSEAALSPYLKERILNELKVVYKDTCLTEK